ncbi:DgyrCDS9213 [Dimorphilus gyrociliatus]|uniref:DgyrCDS9213 n=1 Tax=Dimorphilus gyrociliatus TaxID=2664684 RepID=A0A7I8VY32_9ANNE|nr:DgyrCDS9213 [Dimorphilus gyrociliatus]
METKKKISIDSALNECKKANASLFYVSNSVFDFLMEISGDEKDKRNLPGKIYTTTDTKGRDYLTFVDKVPYKFHGFTIQFKSNYFEFNNKNKCFYMEEMKYGFSPRYTVNEFYCDKRFLDKFYCRRPSYITVSLSKELENSGNFSSCPHGFFRCVEDDLCINSINICDGQDDCFSGEDERNCSTVQEFHCSSNQKISVQFVCDFVYDCRNKLDEVNCGNRKQKHCKLYIYSIASVISDTPLCNKENSCDNRQCIEEKYFCDDEKHCFDDSDEKCNLGYSTINETMFTNDYVEKRQCQQYNKIPCDNKCISEDDQCNLQPDCFDGSDETQKVCDNKVFNVSRCGQLKDIMKYKCQLVYNSMGKLLTKVHFPFSSLTDCNVEKCQHSQYLCYSSKYCISIKQVCDGISHCTHGDDESDCGKNFSRFLLKKKNTIRILPSYISLQRIFDREDTLNVEMKRLFYRSTTSAMVLLTVERGATNSTAMSLLHVQHIALVIDSTR